MHEWGSPEKNQYPISYSLSRHTVMYRATQENEVCLSGVSILTRTTKLQFSHIRSSVMSYPNVQSSYSLHKEGHIPSLNKILSAILQISVSKVSYNFVFFPSLIVFAVISHTFSKIFCNLLILIKPKFGASISGPEVNIYTNFSVNLIEAHAITASAK